MHRSAKAMEDFIAHSARGVAKSYAEVTVTNIGSKNAHESIDTRRVCRISSEPNQDIVQHLHTYQTCNN